MAQRKIGTNFNCLSSGALIEGSNRSATALTIASA
jgi:hypothetical protein